MPSLIGKNLHLCFPKMKLPLQLEPSPTIVKNYNSLFDHDHCNFESSSDPKLQDSSLKSTGSSSPSSCSSSPEPDLSSVFASRRFFFSSPGRSNSITESVAPSSTTQSSNTIKFTNSLDLDDPTILNNNNNNNICSTSGSNNSNSSEAKVKDSVAVSTYSPDPYADFRRSMQEMVEARDLADVNANWEYLHQLLSSYLALNPKNTHKYIIGAFADLLVSLLSSATFSPEINGAEGRDGGDYGPSGCEISRHCM